MNRLAACALAELLIVLIPPLLPLDSGLHRAVLMAGGAGLAAAVLGLASALFGWIAGARSIAAGAIMATAALLYAGAWLAPSGWFTPIIAAAALGVCLGAAPVFVRLGALRPGMFATLWACGMSVVGRLRHVVLPVALPALLAGVAVAYGSGFAEALLWEQRNLAPLALLVLFPAAFLSAL